MGSSNHGGEMCLEGGGRGGRRGGAGKKAAEQKVAKQPQRGLGVAQLEKIRMQNQMMAAYHSGLQPPSPPHQQVHFAGAVPAAGASSSQPNLTDCFDAMDRRIADVQYYGNMAPYNSSWPPATRQPPPPLFVHEAGDSPRQRRQPPQYYWMSSGHEASGRSSAGNSEELDLELRL